MLDFTTPTRQCLPLNGAWQLHPDFFNVGNARQWFAGDTDPDGWLPMPVPGHYELVYPDLFGYEGVMWYRRSVDMPAVDPERHYTLRFLGANYRTAVWVNGQLVGEHEGGYSAFAFDVTDALHAGENLVVVRCDNNIGFADCPPMFFGWTNYGGLYREVELLATPRQYIHKIAVVVREMNGESAHLQVTVDLGGFTGERQLHVLGRIRREGEVAEAAGFSFTARTGGQRVKEVTVSHPAVWSPETPALYVAEVVLHDGNNIVLDTAAVTFGIRTITCENGTLLLNGRPLTLHGVNRHEIYADYGRITTPERLQCDLALIKDAGANTVRACHYPHHPLFYAACDRLGLLVIAEIPFYWWNIGWIREARGAENTPAAMQRSVAMAEEQLGEMIRQLDQHPCIIAWSVANECESTTPRARRAMGKLIRAAHRLDPTRPATFAIAADPDSRCLDLPDFLMCNIYTGVFGSDRSGCLAEIAQGAQAAAEVFAQLRARTPAGTPIVVSEFGSEAVHGFHGDSYGSEEMQAAQMAAYYRAFRAQPGCAGALVWSFSDYRYPTIMSALNLVEHSSRRIGLFGVVDAGRHPKLSYQALRELWLGNDQ